MEESLDIFLSSLESKEKRKSILWCWYNFEKKKEKKRPKRQIIFTGVFLLEEK